MQPAVYLKAEQNKPPGVKVIEVPQVLFYIWVSSLIQFVPHMGLEEEKESEINWQTSMNKNAGEEGVK